VGLARSRGTRQPAPDRRGEVIIMKDVVVWDFHEGITWE
jgi:hypothetical protein